MKSIFESLPKVTTGLNFAGAVIGVVVGIISLSKELSDKKDYSNEKENES